MQTEIVDVKFASAGKAYSFSPNGLNLNVGNKVLVETVKGTLIGQVTKANHMAETEAFDENIKNVIRLATSDDIRKDDALKIKARSIAKETQALANAYKLDMNIVNAEISFDESKITINFTSENRIDFRELVKELGSKFRSRIELRQIGSRDEVKLVGGLGPCGNVCCCKDFLCEFEKVSIKMPKVQGLSLNPSKISGLCGRLMCCLAYENGHYSETFRKMPRVNSEVETPSGKGIVVYNNLLKETVDVRIGSKDGVNEVVTFPLTEIKITSRNSVGIDDDPGDKLSNLE